MTVHPCEDCGKLLHYDNSEWCKECLDKFHAKRKADKEAWEKVLAAQREASA